MGSRSGSETPAKPESVALVDPAVTGTQGRPRRSPGWRVVPLVAVAVLVAAGVAVAVAMNDTSSDTEAVNTFAPNVTVGEANLVVLATTFDAQGARNLIAPSLVTTLGDVPGIEAAEGVLRSHVAMRDADGRTLGHGRSTLAPWNGTAARARQPAPADRRGRRPER
jgi:hypothetical protein